MIQYRLVNLFHKNEIEVNLLETKNVKIFESKIFFL